MYRHIISGSWFNILETLYKKCVSEESNIKATFFSTLLKFECGIHLICELLCRGEVMQGVMRREKRVVMVEICMVEVVEEEVVLQPARSRLVGQVRGQIYSWRGQRLLVCQLETAQAGLPWKITLLLTSEIWTNRFWLMPDDFMKPKMYFAMAVLLNLGTGKDIENWHCHGECAWMSWDIEPNRLDYQFCSFWTARGRIWHFLYTH